MWFRLGLQNMIREWFMKWEMNILSDMLESDTIDIYLFQLYIYMVFWYWWSWVSDLTAAVGSPLSALERGYNVDWLMYNTHSKGTLRTWIGNGWKPYCFSDIVFHYLTELIRQRQGGLDFVFSFFKKKVY